MSSEQAPQIIALDNCFVNPHPPGARPRGSTASTLHPYMSDGQKAIARRPYPRAPSPPILQAGELGRAAPAAARRSGSLWRSTSSHRPACRIAGSSMPAAIMSWGRADPRRESTRKHEDRCLKLITTTHKLKSASLRAGR